MVFPVILAMSLNFILVLLNSMLGQYGRILLAVPTSSDVISSLSPIAAILPTKGPYHIEISLEKYIRNVNKLSSKIPTGIQKYALSWTKTVTVCLPFVLRMKIWLYVQFV